MRADPFWTDNLAGVHHHKQTLIFLRYTNKDHFPDNLHDVFSSLGFTLARSRRNYRVQILILKVLRLAGCTSLFPWQHRHAVSYVSGQTKVLPFFPAGKIALFTGHDLSRMHNVEKNQSDEHRQRIQTILVSFMARD